MFRRHTLIFEIRFPGGYRSRVTPVPIPNTEVKPATADGTVRVTAWESRSLPGFFLNGPSGSFQTGRFLFGRQPACMHGDNCAVSERSDANPRERSVTCLSAFHRRRVTARERVRGARRGRSPPA